MQEHTSFMPHGICYLWKPELVWLHAVSDTVIALAYYAIPFALAYLVVRTRREARALGVPGPSRGLPYEWMFVAFGTFIIACGTTHAIGVWTVWQPVYWLSGGVKAVTAVASVATAVALPPLIPRAVNLFREARMSEIQQAQLSHLASIVEHTEDAIITADLAGRVTSWNRAAERIYGFRADDIVGTSIGRTVPADRRDEAASLLEQVLRGQSVVNLETQRLHADGHLVDLALTVSPVRAADGTIVAASAIARDNTERRLQAERQMELVRAHAAKEQAEQVAQELTELNAAKSEFLAVMSHELRTPLNAVVGYADLLESEMFGALTDEQRLQLTRISASVDHLRGLIDQILQFTRLEAGIEERANAPTSLAAAMAEVRAIVEPGAVEKGVALTFDVEDGLLVQSDVVYLRQVLINLLSNAIKFTPRGSITLTARSSGSDVTVDVRDEGIGIAAEHIERIFDPFWQVDRGLSRRSGGTGLGLTVARRLARVMGGELTATSELGRGSTFHLRLPRAEPTV